MNQAEYAADYRRQLAKDAAGLVDTDLECRIYAHIPAHMSESQSVELGRALLSGNAEQIMTILRHLVDYGIAYESEKAALDDEEYAASTEGAKAICEAERHFVRHGVYA